MLRADCALKLHREAERRHTSVNHVIADILESWASRQLESAGDTQVIASPGAEGRSSHQALLKELHRSPIFKARMAGKRAIQVRLALTQVMLLLNAGGRMSLTQLSRAMDSTVYRVADHVSELESMMNKDGRLVIEFDRPGRQVRLNRFMLVETYGLTARRALHRKS